jgi:hypothetical protein
VAIDIWGKYVAMSGRFKSLTRYEVGLVVRGHGAYVVPKIKDGITITDANLRKTLGRPLADYRERLQRAFDEWSARTKSFKATRLEFGKGCTAKTLKKIEDRIGFALPDAARTLFSAIDGIALVRAKKAVPELAESPSWGVAVHQDGPYWRALEKQAGFGLAVIPPVETMFFSDAATRLVPTAGDDNLFLFDAFSPQNQAWLRADKKTEQLSVVLGTDYSACLTDHRPLAFEAYLEALVTNLGGARPFVHVLRPLPDS